MSPSFLYEFGYSVPLDKKTLIVNCAYPGDTLRKMVDWSTNTRFHNQLFDYRYARKWDGIFLSAGGNDIIDAALVPSGGILQSCANPTSFRDFVIPTAISTLEDHLRDHFRYLVELRNSSEIIENRTIPIFYHTYGYPTPRNAPASGLLGPWLYQAFNDKKIPPDYWQALSNFLIDELAGTLRDLRKIHSNLKLVDSLAKVTLDPADKKATGSSGDWLNEIHLNHSGKMKIAKYWATFL